MSMTRSLAAVLAAVMFVAFLFAVTSGHGVLGIFLIIAACVVLTREWK